MPGPRPELEVCLLQVVIQDPQVPALPREGLARGSMLQDLSHSPERVALGGGQGATRCHGHNVEGVGGHNGWVQEAVVQEVPDHLRVENTIPEAPWGPRWHPALLPNSHGWKGPRGPTPSSHKKHPLKATPHNMSGSQDGNPDLLTSAGLSALFAHGPAAFAPASRRPAGEPARGRSSH